ncbi:MAG TPA: signal peptide peptidase SppA [Bryobacteraceae bacterium]|nr:signal peptide peptidase SppA [Bryobacteraceae bacterium]
MGKFLIGLVSGIVLSILVAFIAVFVLLRFAASFGEKAPTISDGSTLVFSLEGEIPEKAPPEIPLPMFEDQAPVTMHQVWQTFRKAAADPHIKAIMFEPRSLAVGWGKLEEIRGEMLQFRKSGKPLIAFLRGGGAKEYYLATAADRIYMTPEDLLDLKGLRVEAMFLKNTLDKVGVHADVVHAGKYKDAGDILTQTSMTPETQEVLNAILDQYYGDLVQVIADGRKKTPDQVRSIIDNGPFMASDAQQNGLVDALAFDDQVAGDLQKRLGQNELKKVPIRSYLKVPASSLNLEGGQRIALIVGEGEITRGSPTDNPNDQSGFTSTAFEKLLRTVENDSTIKAAVIRIDSPGGDGIASDDILHEAQLLSHKKPVVISMGDVAASGGYFVAMTGDPIVAYPNTLTGSIGVITAKFDLKGLYDKVGVQKQLLTRGQYADLDSDYEPLTGKNRDKITQEVTAFYDQFKDRVAKGRKKPIDQVETLAQGRVWTGQEAKQNGLIDELGGIDTAIDLAKKRANIGAGEKVTLVVYPPRQTIFDRLFSHSDDNAAVESKISKLLGGFPVKSLTHGGFLKLMPYTIRVY